MRRNGRIVLVRTVTFGHAAILLRRLSDWCGRAADHFGRRARHLIGSELCPVCSGRGLVRGVECDTCLGTGGFMDQ